MPPAPCPAAFLFIFSCCYILLLCFRLACRYAKREHIPPWFFVIYLPARESAFAITAMALRVFWCHIILRRRCRHGLSIYCLFAIIFPRRRFSAFSRLFTDEPLTRGSFSSLRERRHCPPATFHAKRDATPIYVMLLSLLPFSLVFTHERERREREEKRYERQREERDAFLPSSLLPHEFSLLLSSPPWVRAGLLPCAAWDDTEAACFLPLSLRVRGLSLQPLPQEIEHICHMSTFWEQAVSFRERGKRWAYFCATLSSQPCMLPCLLSMRMPQEHIREDMLKVRRRGDIKIFCHAILPLLRRMIWYEPRYDIFPLHFLLHLLRARWGHVTRRLMILLRPPPSAIFSHDMIYDTRDICACLIFSHAIYAAAFIAFCAIAR